MKLSGPALGLRQESALQALVRDAADLGGYKLRTQTRRQLQATYYDTEDKHLRKIGAYVRVRSDGKKQEATLKLPPSVGTESGMHLRQELNFALQPDAMDELGRQLEALGVSVGAEGPGILAPGVLRPVMRMETDRLDRVAVRADTDVATLSIDRVRYPDLEPDLVYTEIEVELLPGGDPADLHALAESVLRNGSEPWVRSPLSKVERGYLLAEQKR